MNSGRALGDPVAQSHDYFLQMTSLNFFEGTGLRQNFEVIFVEFPSHFAFFENAKH